MSTLARAVMTDRALAMDHKLFERQTAFYSQQGRQSRYGGTN